MKITAFSVLIGLVLATAAAAQGTPSGKADSPGRASKGQLSEVRSVVHELQGHTEKLRDLMAQYRSLVEQRPQAEGGSPDEKKAHEAQLERWSAAVERLLKRVDGARAQVVETVQRLDRAVTGELPTALAKDVASARNEADAERANAEQALTKSKTSPARKSKPAKQPPASDKPTPELPDDIDL
jgi:hypothetical protein